MIKRDRQQHFCTEAEGDDGLYISVYVEFGLQSNLSPPKLFLNIGFCVIFTNNLPCVQSHYRYATYALTYMFIQKMLLKKGGSKSFNQFQNQNQFLKFRAKSSPDFP